MKKIALLFIACVSFASCGSNGQCERCNGTGICQACDGDGIFTIGNNITGQWENEFCYSCGTSGKCMDCGGTGRARD